MSTLDASTKARIRAEEVERARVRAEIEAEQARSMVKPGPLKPGESGCVGCLGLFLKVMGW
ncbi:hypothetical protein [Deinococcus sp. UYEF24]